MLILGVGFLVAAALPTTGEERVSTAIAKFKDYRSWHLVTPQAIDMEPIIALSCVGPSSFDQPPTPHAPRLFKVYVNATGRGAMTAKVRKAFPVGSTIVKEKFVRPAGSDWHAGTSLAKDARPELLTAMVKREKGFDAANGDWEYVVLSGDTTRKTTESLKHCAACHQGRKKVDYVFGEYGTLHWGTGVRQ